MKLIFLPAALFFALSACTSTEQETATNQTAEVVPPNLTAEMSTTETVGATGRNHGYLRRVYQQKGQYYATVDYIQFLTGEAAVAAARRKGDAAEDVSQDGDTTYSVFNDYYIINDSPRLRTVRLSPTATITLWRSAETGLEEYPATPAQLQEKDAQALGLSPFIIETRQGLAVSLSQQYVP
ncbi:hypothetical protein HER32_04460 [Hymenobacter sp. BT18]|uniref:hypothetical protein n=1 Tax=Hymenobacter sp. BT18 TaxID=2835648 RepID=UPI00143EC445|nr:hypothetical protein [Hymenobacter sp. BT18]QIX60478.1 hypothetical protein HER32_04460 [Hymenobacter sp. BT18]